MKQRTVARQFGVSSPELSLESSVAKTNKQTLFEPPVKNLVFK